MTDDKVAELLVEAEETLDALASDYSAISDRAKISRIDFIIAQLNEAKGLLNDHNI
jgi:hypothetical protein